MRSAPRRLLLGRREVVADRHQFLLRRVDAVGQRPGLRGRRLRRGDLLRVLPPRVAQRGVDLAPGAPGLADLAAGGQQALDRAAAFDEGARGAVSPAGVTKGIGRGGARPASSASSRLSTSTRVGKGRADRGRRAGR